MGIYSYIKGIVVDKGEDTVVIDNNGIGYEIICPYSISMNLPLAGEEAKIWIYQSVREDDITLYGFVTPQMKDMFLIRSCCYRRGRRLPYIRQGTG